MVTMVTTDFCHIAHHMGCVHVHTDAAVAMVTAIPVQLDLRGIAIATEDELYTRQDQLRAAVILSGMSHSL